MDLRSRRAGFRRRPAAGGTVLLLARSQGRAPAQAPGEVLHVVAPRNNRHRRPRHQRRRDNLPLQALRPGPVTPPLSQTCAHNRTCGHFSPRRKSKSNPRRPADSEKAALLGGIPRLAISVAGLPSAMLRIVCSAATTGASVRSGSTASIYVVNLSTDRAALRQLQPLDSGCPARGDARSSAGTPRRRTMDHLLELETGHPSTVQLDPGRPAIVASLGKKASSAASAYRRPSG